MMTCKHGNHSMHCGWCEDQARITELESEVKALRQQIQDNALQQLASEGQWIELTGSLRADAERWRAYRRNISFTVKIKGTTLYCGGHPFINLDEYGPAADAAIDAARNSPPPIRNPS